jgi:hypothetical protein
LHALIGISADASATVPTPPRGQAVACAMSVRPSKNAGSNRRALAQRYRVPTGPTMPGKNPRPWPPAPREFVARTAAARACERPK